jgi:NADPH:quinone reductase-like Zn-dependent oxidoreductase
MPTPGPGQVRVEVLAAGVNPGEASIRSGALHSRFPATFPSGEGSDLAGVVSSLGPGASLFKQGDEVLGWTWDRASHAEYVVVPEMQLIPKPARLSWEAAGSLHVVGVTAYAAVEAVDPLEGDVVAVSAAAGGVGSLVVQLLGLRGASVVAIASKANHVWLKGKGTTPVAYGPDLRRDLEAAASGGIDAFIDLFGPEYVQLAIDLGVAPERIDTITSATAGELGVKTEGSMAGTSTEVLAHLADLIASDQVELPIAATFSLDEVQKAFELVEQRHTHGKVVLVP